MTLVDLLPIAPGNWDYLQDFLAVGHNPDGTTIGGGSVFNASDYGCVAGSSSDQTPHIQAAIDAAKAPDGTFDGGGVVQLPPGRITVNTTIRIKNCVWLRGSGNSDLHGTANPFIALPASGVCPDRMKISDLALTGPPGDGIHFQYSALTGGTQLGWPRYVVEDVVVADAGGSAFKILDGLEMRFINCVSLRSVVGFDLTCVDSQFIGCSAGEGTSPWIIRGSTCKLVSCKGYGGTSHGFQVVGSGRHTLAGCEAQDNEGAGFSVESTWNTVQSCVSDTSGTAGVQISGSSNIVDVASMYGGGGSGQVTPVGFKMGSQFTSPPSGNIVRGVTNCAVPVGGWTEDNDISVHNVAGGRFKTVAYAASVTPDPYQGEIQKITLTGNLTIVNPTLKHTGQPLSFEFLQDGVGGRAVTFPSTFRTNWTPDTAADKLNIISFEYDGRFWQQRSAQTGLTSRAALATDSFNRANGAIGTADSGQVWTTVNAGSGAWNIATNKAVNTGAPAFSLNFAVIDVGVADYVVQFTAGSSLSGRGGLVFRYTDSSNYIFVDTSGVVSVVAGVQHTLDITGPTLVASDVLKAVVSGPSVAFYLNGAQNAYGVIPTNLTGTKVGFWGGGVTPDPIFDVFSVT